MVLRPSDLVPAVLVAAAGLGLALPAAAACLSGAKVATRVGTCLAQKPAPNPEGRSDADGACTRAKFNAQSAPIAGGPAVGNKAGLTNPAVHKRFNATAPVRGALYAPMLLKDGVMIDANCGARLLFETDLMPRVSDAATHPAKPRQQVVVAIDRLIPAIERPDRRVEVPPKRNGAAIAAIDVGTRDFVLGAPILPILGRYPPQPSGRRAGTHARCAPAGRPQYADLPLRPTPRRPWPPGRLADARLPHARAAGGADCDLRHRARDS